MTVSQSSSNIKIELLFLSLKTNLGKIFAVKFAKFYLPCPFFPVCLGLDFLAPQGQREEENKVPVLLSIKLLN